MTEPRFLTLADVAAVLNISDSQTYALVRSGELPAIKIGGRGQWRVEASEPPQKGIRYLPRRTCHRHANHVRHWCVPQKKFHHENTKVRKRERIQRGIREGPRLFVLRSFSFSCFRTFVLS